MGRLFKRAAELTIASPVAGDYFRQSSNAVVIKDLRVVFKVSKKIGSKPNDANITVVNLAEKTRAAFQVRPLQVRLDVGYSGSLARIFSGDVRWVRSIHERVDWETTIEAGDGERAYKYARVSRSYKSNVSLRTALEDTAATMGLKLPKSVDDAKELAVKFANGVTLQGPSSEEMTRLLKSKQLQWSVQDGRLQILSKSGTRPDQAVVISADTGMIGVPELGEPDEKGKAPKMKVKALLDDQKAVIVPGGRVKLETKSLNGVFKVTSVDFIGDTRGHDWYCEVEGTPL